MTRPIRYALTAICSTAFCSDASSSTLSTSSIGRFAASSPRDFPRTNFDEGLHALRDQKANRPLPLHRSRHLADEGIAAAVGVREQSRVDVAGDRELRDFEGEAFRSVARRSCAGFISEQWKGALTGSSLAFFAPRSSASLVARSTRRFPRDDDLLRRIDVGELAHLSMGRIMADAVTFVEIHAEDRRHRAHPYRHRFLHVLAAIAHGADRVCKIQRACGHVRRVFTQAMPGDIPGP